MRILQAIVLKFWLRARRSALQNHSEKYMLDANDNPMLDDKGKQPKIQLITQPDHKMLKPLKVQLNKPIED